MIRLTIERENKKLSKAQLGFNLRIHPSLIGKFENGTAKPYKPSQEKLEVFFGLSVDELLQEAKYNEIRQQKTC